jgi:hypothetical protein
MMEAVAARAVATVMASRVKEMDMMDIPLEKLRIGLGWLHRCSERIFVAQALAE